MTHTNAQKLEILNTFRAAEGLAPFAMWKVARHQPMLDAYRAAQEAKQDAEFEASQAELAAQTVRPVTPTKEEQVAPVTSEHNGVTITHYSEANFGFEHNGAFYSLATLAAAEAKVDSLLGARKVAPVAKPVKEKAPKVAKSETVRQNGVRFPRVGGLCWQAWQMFDELRAAHPAGFDVKVALAEGAKRNFNDNNIRTELCCWRKFHGIAARAPKA